MTSNQQAFEVPAEMRDLAEKSVEQARSAVSTMMQNARKAASTLQSSTKVADLPASLTFSRGLEFTEQNVGAVFDLARKLVRARDAQEAIQLQSEYVTTQIAALQTQAKELFGAASPTTVQSV
jgi:phasin